MIPESELDRLDALAHAATPGPWEYDGWSDDVTAKGPDGSVKVLSMPAEWHTGSEYTGSWSVPTGKGDDLRFAAALNPQQVLALTAEVRRLRALVGDRNLAAIDRALDGGA